MAAIHRNPTAERAPAPATLPDDVAVDRIFRAALVDLEDQGLLTATWHPDDAVEVSVDLDAAVAALRDGLAVAGVELRRRRTTSTLIVEPQRVARGTVAIWWWRTALDELRAQCDSCRVGAPCFNHAAVAIELADAPADLSVTNSWCVDCGAQPAALTTTTPAGSHGAQCQACLELEDLQPEPGSWTFAFGRPGPAAPRVSPAVTAVLAEVGSERLRQDRRGDVYSLPLVAPALMHRPVGWLAEHYEIPTAARARQRLNSSRCQGDLTYGHVLIEEVAEAIECGPDRLAMRAELVQVAAVAVAMVETIDRQAP
jgi:hypothetical protein